MRTEYEFDYDKAQKNRFASRYAEGNSLVVVLEPDIAEVFTTPDAVRSVLRALISTMPGITKPENVKETPASA